jgi:hypothetical protein
LLTAEPATPATTVAATSAAVSALLLSVSATLSAAASDVADLAALVAFLSTTGAALTAEAATRAASWCSWALARQVTGLAAVVASLVLSRLGALAGEMALLTAVVACWCSLAGALSSLVGWIAA